jgi:hypothetical protein
MRRLSVFNQIWLREGRLSVDGDTMTLMFERVTGSRRSSRRRI